MLLVGFLKGRNVQKKCQKNFYKEFFCSQHQLRGYTAYIEHHSSINSADFGLLNYAMT